MAVKHLPDEQLYSCDWGVSICSLLEVVEVGVLWVLALQPKIIIHFISENALDSNMIYPNS